jgi:hypothetical protein
MLTIHLQHVPKLRMSGNYNYTSPLCLRGMEREKFTLPWRQWKIVFLISILSSHLLVYSSEFSVQIIILQIFEAICTEIQLCVGCYRATVTVKHIAENLLQPAARRKYACSPREFLNTLVSQYQNKIHMLGELVKLSRVFWCNIQYLSC